MGMYPSAEAEDGNPRGARVRRAPAGFTALALDGYGFVTSCSLVPPGLPPIRFLFVESRLCSTVPSDPAS